MPTVLCLPSGETQSSSPRASGSRENASRSKPSIVRLPSRDNRQPYSDEDSLQQFVATVERYVKQLDTLTKPSLKGPTPLDTEWQVSKWLKSLLFLWYEPIFYKVFEACEGCTVL